MKIKVLLFGTSDSCARLRMYLRDEELGVVGGVSDENLVLEEISRSNPDLVLITDTSPAALRACQQIYLLRPRSIPVVIADADEMVRQRIMQTGVHYILTPDVGAETMASELKAIFNNEANRILALESKGSTSNKSQVVVVFSAKDGVGKSVLAVNLAVKLVQRGNKVVVLDYDFQFGDVGSLFGGDYKSTILELVQEQAAPNVDIIRQFLSLHVSGVNFLPAPNEPEYADSITTMQAERIIAALRVYYDYVIVDTGSGFNDITASCIDCASQILFMTEKNIPALRNTKKSIAIIKALTDTEKIKLIISRDGDFDVSDSDVARVLGVPVWHTTPSDYRAVSSSSNQGSPLVMEYPKSKTSVAIKRLCEKIDGVSVSAKNKPIHKQAMGGVRKG